MFRVQKWDTPILARYYLLCPMTSKRHEKATLLRFSFRIFADLGGIADQVKCLDRESCKLCLSVRCQKTLAEVFFETETLFPDGGCKYT